MGGMRPFALSIVCLVSCLTAVDVSAQTRLELSCSAFGPGTSAAELSARFGSSNVADGGVYVGEGFYEPGTVLFADDPEQRVEILWKEEDAKRSPESLRIRGDKSQWRTPHGLTLGMDLQTVERINRRPFRLRGFGWDYGGTTTSWSGGAFAGAETPGCVVWARFLSDEEHLTTDERRLFHQVRGEREFSSGHPGVHASHARVWQFGLVWRE